MFWGLVLEPGKRYSTTVEKSFHVSKAVLDCSSVRNDNEILSVMLETEGSEALLCNLCKQKGILQENLDLNFMSGDRLTFECRGHGRIHLSGYLLPDDDDMSGMMGDESEEEEEETEWSGVSSPEKPKKDKRKLDASPDEPPKKKKTKTNQDGEEGGESDSEQEDESDLSELEEESFDEDEESDNEESDNDLEEIADSEDENNATLSSKEKKKQFKEEKKTPNKQNSNTPKKTPLTNGITPKEQKSNKKTPGGDKTPNQSPNQTPKQKKILDNGVVIKEIRAGSGIPAKIGKTVTVYYVGRLRDSGKVFDKQMKGEGFKFKLGKGEVIKGWDIGVQNMKVGGKRVIHCPAEAAYGAKGVPPKIPPNSALVFDVELRSVN